MTKKYNILAVLLVFSLCLTLSSCESAESASSTASVSPQTFASPTASASPENISETDNTGYWPKEAPDNSTIETAIWEFNQADIGDLSTISVSPSGKYILAAGIPSPLDRTVDCLYIFTNQDGGYTKISSIEVDADPILELPRSLIGGREDLVAWSEDETRVIISVGLKRPDGDSQSAIYLADIPKQTLSKLTGDDDIYYFLPQWVDNDNIRFIHRELDSDNMVIVSLVAMNLKTGKEELLSDLSAEGKIASILDYRIYGETIYFSRECTDPAYAGFFTAKLDGGNTPPKCLLNMQEIRDSNIHPYTSMFSSVQISSNGRWACVTAYDMRFSYRDIPTADDPLRPQADPNSAVALNGRAWIPCHNVFLYDLKNNTLVDPFTDAALRPDVAIVTAATFAPDGKSLLCAVFGDVGEWTQACFEKTTLYQIRLDDGSFKTVKIFKTDVLTTPDKLTWLGNNSLLLRTWEGTLPTYPVQIILPAAFERLAR